MSATVRKTLAGLSLLAAPVTMLVVWLAVRAELPDPIATHWGFGNVPDGFSRVGPFVAAITVAGAAGTALGIAALARPSYRATGRVQVAVCGWAVWLLTAVGASSLLVARGATDAQDIRSGWMVILVVLCAGPAGAVLAYRLAPRAPEPEPAAEVPTASYRLEPGERAVWVGTAASRPLLLAAAVIAVVGAGLAAFSVLWTGVAMMIAVALFWTHCLTVRVDNDAVTAHFGPLGWPVVRTPMARIRSAAVDQIEPLSWGGWGYRLSRRGAALVVRRGPGLVLGRRGGTDLAITVDDAATGAELVNALLSARASAPGSR